MDAIRFPSLADLNLDPRLRQLIAERGGKVGVLDYIVEQNASIPTRKHIPRREITFKGAKRAAKSEKIPLLVRSNNDCEYLPGTEGRFETVMVWDFDGPSDEIIFRKLFNRPKYPMPHLKADWPKRKSEMRFGVVPALKEAFYVNLIEHPNHEGFWFTISDGIGNKETYISNEPSFEGANSSLEIPKSTLEKIVEIAQAVSKIDGLDSRYTKQMELVFNEEEIILSQAKILLPKKYTPAPSIKLPESVKKRLYRTLGVFDFELNVRSSEKTEWYNEKDIALVLSSPKEVITRGTHYKDNVKVGIFQRAEGLLMHADIPYVLRGEGIAISESFGFAISDVDKTQIVSLSGLEGKRARLRSDGTYLYATPLE